MIVQRPDRLVTRTEEIALAESRDLPPRTDGTDQRTPIARHR